MEALSEDVMLEFSGEKDVESIQQLVLRGLGLSSVAPLLSAVNLVSVSLSHNALSTISFPRNALPKLTELNVNSNALSDLCFLAGVPALLRLYASSNQISDISPLAKCSELAAACLHGNRIASLDGAVATLALLPSLQEIELDGNPCEEEGGYRHRVLTALPRLLRLDAEPVTSKDHADATRFVAYQEREKAHRPQSAGSGASGGSRVEVGGKERGDTVGGDQAFFFTHSDISLPSEDGGVGGAGGARPRRRPGTSHVHTRAYQESVARAQEGNAAGLSSSTTPASNADAAAPSSSSSSSQPRVSSTGLAFALAGTSMMMLREREERRMERMEEGGSEEEEDEEVEGEGVGERLFRDEFLACNPILQEYMAQ
ncbi:hypothetical protein T484DRAFT_1877853, partial [Baffinella frigidus]